MKVDNKWIVAQQWKFDTEWLQYFIIIFSDNHFLRKYLFEISEQFKIVSTAEIIL